MANAFTLDFNDVNGYHGKMTVEFEVGDDENWPAYIDDMDTLLGLAETIIKMAMHHDIDENGDIQ